MGLISALEKSHQVQLPSNDDIIIMIVATLSPPEAYGLKSQGYAWVIFYEQNELTMEGWSSDLASVISDAYVNASNLISNGKID